MFVAGDVFGLLENTVAIKPLGGAGDYGFSPL
jgi:hypothetical protein